MFFKSTLYSFIRGKITNFKNLKLVETIKRYPIPQHIAIIMDGNRRFAKDVGIKPEIGHYFGRDKIRETLDWCIELDIRNLTLYAFSTENFKRTPEEIEDLMNLCRQELDKATKDSRIHKNKIRIKIIGNLSLLPEDISIKAEDIMERTRDYDDYTLSIALGYGGREEIVEAVYHIAQDVKEEKLLIDDIDQNIVSSYLYTDGIPDPDLILRTSGEERISNFLLWQMAYSEFYFSDVYWPAFQKNDFLRAIMTYQQRQRRFGT
jgi:tritrans,polycis-undecaprenyl-diphosphate synthase [geranylgeranyl-diphosphate specific]